jgi:ABC-2 type transport system permease protein
MTSISSIAFFLSCFPSNPPPPPSGADLHPGGFHLRTAASWTSYQHLLITKHMAAWGRILAETIDWPLIIRVATPSSSR